MELNQYFSDVTGTGVLSTANKKGAVNSAVYGTPHVTDNRTIQFIMRDRLTRANLQENAGACYLFFESGSRVNGIRLYLTMTGEEQDAEKINALSRRPEKSGDDDAERYLATFQVQRALALIGGDEVELL